MRGTGKTCMEGAELVRMRDRGALRGRGVTYCAALASRGSAAGSDCYLKETEDELSICQVPEGQGELGGTGGIGWGGTRGQTLHNFIR